jgi:hypothetical protein
VTAPFWERPLSDFSDDTITKVRQVSHGGWYASLDAGPEERWASTPDFATCAATPEEAVRRCAETIRNDQIGIGKYAPHSILSGYGLFLLRKHWARKEESGRGLDG